jgi:hypothetical protein
MRYITTCDTFVLTAHRPQVPQAGILKKNTPNLIKTEVKPLVKYKNEVNPREPRNVMYKSKKDPWCTQ